MLFDLRGRGRRRTIQVIYITLAFLLGGGLVFFGIGGDVSGGLVDALTERNTGGDPDDRLEKREQTLVRKVRAQPRDAGAWAELARTRYLLAGQGEGFDRERGVFTAQGKAKLREVSAAWERHLALSGDKPDDRVASLMVQAYGPGGLNQIDKATRAQEVVTLARPTSATYAQLAVLAYQADQTRKGDLARKRALELAEPDMRETLKDQLDQAKSGGAGGTPPTAGG